MSGSPSSARRSSGTEWSGMRMPIVRRRSCCSRRGVSVVAGSRNVYGPGVQALMSRNCQVSSFAKRPTSARLRHTSVKLMMTVCLADSPHALECVFVADMTAERIAGIGGIGDNAARAHDIRRTADKPRLRGCGVQFKVLTHGGCPISSVSYTHLRAHETRHDI